MFLNRTIFFDSVRPMFGSLTQSQVDGMNFILDCWEERAGPLDDLRHLAYPLATTKWETSSTMQPIEEYGKGSGMEYGKPDPITGETYYGRGFVQLTWAENYQRADDELDLQGDTSCYWHAHNALDPIIAAEILFEGMDKGWFRPPNTLAKFFNDTTDDPFNAREIVNGDKNFVKEWAGGAKIGHLIANDHRVFLNALQSALILEPEPDLPVVRILAPPGVRIVVEIIE